MSDSLESDRAEGTILAWNPITLESTVLVGQTRMVNLPVCGASLAASCAEGDVVVLARHGSAWCVILEPEG